MTVITCIEDLRRLAQRRVPRMFYDYADSGSWTESTYRANEDDFRRLKLRQRVAVDMDGRSTATTMIGQPVAMPVAIAPTGLTGMQHADGEILAARAAEKFGVPFTLSTMSICSIEDVAAATRSPFWFQLYLLRDRGFSASLIERAKAARCWCGHARVMRRGAPHDRPRSPTAARPAPGPVRARARPCRPVRPAAAPAPADRAPGGSRCAARPDRPG